MTSPAYIAGINLKKSSLTYWKKLLKQEYDDRQEIVCRRCIPQRLHPAAFSGAKETLIARAKAGDESPQLLSLAVADVKKVRKGAGRMPWLSEAKKDVISCEKPRGLAHTK